MSSRVLERKLFALIADIDVEKEQYIKEEQVIRKETELLVSFYLPFFLININYFSIVFSLFKVRLIKNNASELIQSGIYLFIS
jgi:hypothetical protein